MTGVQPSQLQMPEEMLDSSVFNRHVSSQGVLISLTSTLEPWLMPRVVILLWNRSAVNLPL